MHGNDGADLELDEENAKVKTNEENDGSKSMLNSCFIN